MEGDSAGVVQRAPTMADIAAALGMSRQTVSLALSGLPGPSRETRERVQQVAEELGYRPHLAAQALRRSHSTDLGVVFSPAHATVPEVLEGIYSAAAAAGCGVVLSPQTANRTAQDAVAQLLGHRCSVLVIIGSDLTDAALAQLVTQAGVPVVHLGHGRPADGYDVVRSSGDTGIEQVMACLTDLGHIRIAYVHTPTLRPTVVRRSGYTRAVRRMGLTHDVVSSPGPYAEEAGAEAGRRILARDTLPTAVVCANDQAAFGVMETLRSAGVRVPEEVSVTGFDDTPLARFSFLALTTVDQHPDQLGAAVVEAAVRRRADPDLPTATIVTPTTLVVRGTTGPPRGRPDRA